METSNHKKTLISLGLALTSFVGATLYAKSAMAKPKKAIKKKTLLVKNKGGQVQVKKEAILKIETNQRILVPKDRIRSFVETELKQNDRTGYVYHSGVGSYLTFSSRPTKLLEAPILANQYFNLYLNSIGSPYRSDGNVFALKALNNKNIHYVGFSQPFDIDIRHGDSTTPQIVSVQRPLWAIHASDTGARVGSPLQYFGDHLNNMIGAMLYGEGLVGASPPYGGHKDQQIGDLNVERVAMVNAFMLRLYDALNKYAKENNITKLSDISIDKILSISKAMFLGPKGDGVRAPWTTEPGFPGKFKAMLAALETGKGLERARYQLSAFLNNELWFTPVLTPNCRHFIHPDTMRQKAPDWITKREVVPNLYLIGKTVFSDHGSR